MFEKKLKILEDIIGIEMANKYFAYLHMQNIGDNYILRLIGTMIFLNKRINVSTITKADFERYIKSVFMERSVTTVNYSIATMKHYHSFLYELGYESERTSIMNMRFYTPPDIRFIRPKYIEIDDIRAILNNPMVDIATKMVIAMIFYCGFRIGDILKIKLNDVLEGLDDGIIYSFRSKAEVDVLTTYPKQMKVILLKYLSWREGVKNPFLMLNKSKRLLYYDKAKEMMKVAAVLTFHNPEKREKMRKLITTHRFRHSYATYAVESGMKPTLLMDQMGWKTLAQLGRYARFNKRKKRELIDKYGEFLENYGKE